MSIVSAPFYWLKCDDCGVEEDVWRADSVERVENETDDHGGWWVHCPGPNLPNKHWCPACKKVRDDDRTSARHLA